MRIEEISSYQDLTAYLDKHNQVKTSLLKNLLDKCYSICESDQQASQLILHYKFFGKYNHVVEVLNEKSDQSKLSELINVAIQKKDLETLEQFELTDLLDEDHIENLFKQNLSFDDLIFCLNKCANYSRLFHKAVHHLKSHELTIVEQLILINNLNQILHGVNSILLSLAFVDLNGELFTNIHRLEPQQSRTLQDLRKYLIAEALVKFKEPLNMHFLIDLLSPEDQEVIGFNIESSSKLNNQVKFEHSLKQLLSTEISFFSSLEAAELAEYGTFHECFEFYSKWRTKQDLYLSFNLIKLYFLRAVHKNQQNHLDYVLLLNDSLLSFYIKGLFELNLIDSVPNMDEIFEWPTIHEIRAYVNRYDGKFEEKSPLGYLGYSVAQNSELTKEQRRKILTRAFKYSPLDFPPNYDWGLKGSPYRLECIASHLSMLIRNNRRKSADMQQAINSWKEDLEYLRKKFYDERCALEFSWPSIFN